MQKSQTTKLIFINQRKINPTPTGEISCLFYTFALRFMFMEV